MTEAGETSGMFRSGSISVTDTTKPVVNDGRLSWGRGDTLEARYGDVNSVDTTSDTALALEIATVGKVIFYEDTLYVDDVDTYLTVDRLYVAVHDTDENRNPQLRDTVSVIVYVGNDVNGMILDTETFILTESAETTGVFTDNSGRILTDTVAPAVGDGMLSWGLSDTLFVKYSDITGTTEDTFDTALALQASTDGIVQLYEDANYTDDVDTYLTRDAMFMVVYDTDENRNPAAVETVTVTVYVGNGTAEGADALGLVIDTETLRLTEVGETTGIFRSGSVMLTDTTKPVVNDGRISWGRGDTLYASYLDANDVTDTGFDTALALEIATTGKVIVYEDANYVDDVDTYLTRDAMYIAVHDTDENRNPQLKDTVSVTVYVGNGALEGGDASGLVLDTQTLTVTESGETTGVFQSGAIALTDTEKPVVENSRVSWGRGDTLSVTYKDITGTSEDTVDTALALEIASVARLQIFENAGYSDDVDTFLTRDQMLVVVSDTDENRNPQLRDTISVVVYVGNGSPGGGATGLVIDTDRLTLTETSETSGI
ncbi:MAG: hypothetical protein AABX98_06370, partial [Nanoarchaeota archaeon]